MLHFLSTLVIIIIGLGLYCRHRSPYWHWRIMVTAFVFDLSLVLYIEYNLHVVEKVIIESTPMLWFHATISVLVLLAYLVMFYLGRRLISGEVSMRTAHLYVGITFCILRGTNYITSFIV